MSGLDVERLRAVAEAVPYPGPWRHDDAHVWTATDDDPDEGPSIYVNGGVYRNQRRTAEHIAAFDPPTVLALLDRLAAAEAAVGQFRALAERWEREADERGPFDRVYTHGVAAMLLAVLDAAAGHESAGDGDLSAEQDESGHGAAGDGDGLSWAGNGGKA